MKQGEQYNYQIVKINYKNHTHSILEVVKGESLGATRAERYKSRLTQEERDALMQGHTAFAQEVLARGILTGGAPLQPTRTATTVRVRKGKKMITDGPFAETKEQLAGTYIVDCKDLDEAIELATRIPDALRGSIEIRPIMELGM